jgi:hypothetical protein
MSTKSSIFLTELDEHVYRETSDNSYVFEVDVESLEFVRFKTMNNKLISKTSFIDLEEIEWIVVKTKRNIEFTDICKLKEMIDPIEWVENPLDNLIFDLGEIDTIETNIEKIDCFSITLGLKKDTEWFQEYVKALKEHINFSIEQLNKKLKMCNTIEI